MSNRHRRRRCIAARDPRILGDVGKGGASRVQGQRFGGHRRRKLIGGCAAVLAILCGASTLAQAEDVKGKWYFGGNISFLSTTDYIRSNAAIFIGDPGDDGIPFTGDPNEAPGCTAGGSQGAGSVWCDPRPDDQLGREGTIEETFRLEVSAGFGLTSWLSLQLDASYFTGDVGPVDFFVRDAFPVDTDGIPPITLTRFADREVTTVITAGEITEIPVSLSAIARFRKDSPLNPYVGIGLGRIFTDAETASDVDDLNARLSALRIKGIQNEVGGNLVDPADQPLGVEGRIPMSFPLTYDVEDAWEWHVSAGLEWFQSERFSLIFDAKYMFADSEVRLDLNGEDQVDFTIFSEKLFRPDGSLQSFSSDPSDAFNTPCSAAGRGPLGEYAGGCHPDDNPLPNARVDPDHPRTGRMCPAVGDFDWDGHSDDHCYNKQTVAPSPIRQTRDPSGIAVIQGGSIDLTGLSVAIGVRWHF